MTGRTPKLRLLAGLLIAAALLLPQVLSVDDRAVAVGETGRIEAFVHDRVNRLAGIEVVAYAVDSGSVVTTATTNGNGSCILIVPAGEYRVAAIDSTGAHPTTFSRYNVTTGPTQTGYCDILMPGACVISGRVVDVDGLPVPGVQVRTSSFSWSWYADGSTTTDASGRFEFSQRVPGLVRLYFVDPTYDHAPGYWINGGQTDSVLTAAGLMVDMTMPAAGEIRGRVVDENGESLGGTQVSVTQPDPWGAWTSSTPAAQVATDGAYTLRGLSAGPARVYFGGGDYTIPQYYAGASTVAEATTVTVESGVATNGIDATLTIGGSIDGLFRDATTGEEVPKVDYALCVWSGDHWVEGSWNWSSTGVPGFRYRRLPPGRYSVKIRAPSYGPVYYGDTIHAERAREFVVTASEHATMTITGARWSTLTGHVRSAQTGIAQSLLVTVYTPEPDGTWLPSGSKMIQVLGQFNLQGPFAGMTRIVVTDPSGIFRPLGWPNGDGVATAQDIVLPPGETRSIDATVLAVPSTLTGTVKSSAGGVVPNAVVSVFYKRYPNPIFAATTVAGADGVWRAEGLEAGDYLLAISDPSGMHTPLPMTWEVPPWLPPGGLVTRDKTLARRVSVEGTITGGADGQPIEGASVTLSHSGGGGESFQVTTDASGHYFFDRADTACYLLLGVDDPLGRYGANHPVWPDMPFWLQPGTPGYINLSMPSIASLRLSTAPSIINYGSRSTITATLLPVAGLPGSRQQVDFERLSGTSWVAAGSAVTNSSGVATISVAPEGRATYRARYAGSVSHVATDSAQRMVAVRALIGTPTAPPSIKTGVRFVSSGALKPRHTAGTHPIQLQFYRYSSGRWQLGKTVMAKAFDFGGYSHYYTSLYLPTTGQWRVRAYHADAAHTAAYSAWRYVTVK